VAFFPIDVDTDTALQCPESRKATGSRREPSLRKGFKDIVIGGSARMAYAAHVPLDTILYRVAACALFHW
jgi:hypothetical protein